MGIGDCDLVTYYARHFREGMADLSASSAPAPRLGFMVPVDPAGYGCADYDALRAAIAARYQQARPEDVVLGCGASELLAAVAHALVEPGGVAVCAPGSYPALTAAIDRCGGRRVSCGAPAQATLIAICNPSVPHGNIEDVERWLAVTARAGATLVVDEVYRDLVDGEPPPAACDLEPSAVSISGFSKPLGLGGLRVGWAIIRDESLRARVEREIGLLSGGLSVLSARSALPILQVFDRIVGETMAAVRCNRQAVYDVLDTAGWRFWPPEAGLTVMATPPFPVGEDDLEALREGGFFLLPGSVFGEPGSIRLNLLTDACELARAVGELAGRADRRGQGLQGAPFA